MTCFERLALNIHQRLEENRKKQLQHEYFKRNIEMKDAAVFFFSKKSAKNKKRFKECEFAFSLNKLMYAVVKEGTRWKKYKKLPWRKVYFYADKNELACIMRAIMVDINLVRAAGGK